MDVWKVISGILALVGGANLFWSYLKNRNNNDTKIRLSKAKNEEISKEEITHQYTELLGKFDELEKKFVETEKLLDRALTAFDILYPLIEELVKEKPEFKGAVHQALKHFNKNPS